MSPQRHREKDAKVEGRGQPERAEGTMEAFKALTKRLLKVSPAELAERERVFEETRAVRHDMPAEKKKEKSRKSKNLPPLPANGIDNHFSESKD